jgi:hypothetical protein
MRLMIVGAIVALLAPVAAAEGQWDKDAKTGCEVWTAEPQPSQQVHWSGKCFQGKANGRGTITWSKKDADGEVVAYYVGQVKEGRRDGKGSYFFPNGGKYFGEYRQNLPHGFGIYTAPDGGRYEGKYQEGEKHGVGIRTWPDGAWYEGPFVHDTMVGRGVYHYPNGNRYEGEFVSGEMHGMGTAYYTDGSRYKGPFVKGKQEGAGSCLLKDNTWAPCEWKNGEFVRWIE